MTLCFAIALISLTSCKDSNGVESNKIETPDGAQSTLFFNVIAGKDSKLYKCYAGKISLVKDKAFMIQEPIGDKIVCGVFSPSDSMVSIYTTNSDFSSEQLMFKYKDRTYDGFPILSIDMKYMYLAKRKQAAVNSDPDTIYIVKYNLADKTEKVIIKQISRETMIEQSPDGTKLAYFTYNNLIRGELHICDANGGSDITLGASYNDHHDLYYHLVWSRDGKYLTTCDYDKTKFNVFSSDGTLLSSYTLDAKSAEKMAISYSSSIQIPGSNYAYAANDHNGNITIYKSNLTTPWHVEKSDTNQIFAFPCFDKSGQNIAWLSNTREGKTHVHIMNLSDMKINVSDFIYVVDNAAIDTYVFPRLYWGK